MRYIRLYSLMAVGLLASALVACGDTRVEAIPGAATPVEDPFAGGYPMYRSEEHGLRIIVGTPDVGAGEPRVSLAIFDAEGVVASSSLTVRTFYFPDGAGGPRDGPLDEHELTYSEFPLGGRGIYSGVLALDAPGLYALEADVPRPGGASVAVLVPLEVAAEPRAPDVGDEAPRSEHRTLADVGAIEELTTSYEPDLALYQETIAEAVDSGRPSVVVFASPAFCTTALCGPQVELVSELAAEYGEQAAFVHVDLYENPHEIQGDLDRARGSPVLDEWNLETDQWTFVIDANGRIAARFEGFVPRDELEVALLEAIEEG